MCIHAWGACSEVPYATATVGSHVVDMGATSVPPISTNCSPTEMSRMPRHRSRLALATSTARSLRIASVRKKSVAAKGCGSVRLVSRSGSLSERYAAVVYSRSAST